MINSSKGLGENKKNLIVIFITIYRIELFDSYFMKSWYRTSNIQVIFQLILDLTRDTEGQKKDSPIILTDESSLVAGTRLERATFGL
jgi:hypothetical protein